MTGECLQPGYRAIMEIFRVYFKKEDPYGVGLGYADIEAEDIEKAISLFYKDFPKYKYTIQNVTSNFK